VLAFLSGQSASGTDSALRQLGMEIMRERDELALFLDFVAMALPRRTNFELVQAYLALFLKIHAEVVAAHPSLQAKVAALRAQQRAAWRTLEELFQRNMCLVQYLSNVM
jgi:U3 small nucleolar RNA-associated protein 21